MLCSPAKEGTLLIEGYTDDLGARELNVRLGEKRAASAKKSLACRAKNRRVRFLVKER